METLGAAGMPQVEETWALGLGVAALLGLQRRRLHFRLFLGGLALLRRQG